MVGPYQVGHTEFYMRIGGNAVSVYYPVDREEYKRTINLKGRNTKWLRYGKRSIKGLTMAAGEYDAQKPRAECFFNYMKRIYMDTVQNGNISKDFCDRKQKLIPIILLHGLAGSRTSQSGSCRDMASHGYIVFSVDHLDGSAFYSRKKDGSEIFWPLSQKVDDFNGYQNQVKIRQKEVGELIDQIFEANFLQQTLGFSANIELDLDKLVVGGHSFGGLTAMVATQKDERIKALFTFDPWVWTRHKQIMQEKFALNLS